MTALARILQVEPRPEERRKHSRIRVTLPGQFMRESREEFPCVTINISPGGVALASEEQVSVGERIVAYLIPIGRLQGLVVRVFYGGFAISMKLPPVKREKLADQLTWLVNRQELGMPEDRRHARNPARMPHTTLILPGGRELIAKIIDISRSGCALAVSSAQPVGTPVTVGSTRGRIVRQFTNGLGIEFARVIPENEFSEDLIL